MNYVIGCDAHKHFSQFAIYEEESRQLKQIRVEHQLGAIRELLSEFPEGTRTKDPDLPGLQMIAVRNRLIHGYDSVDFDILWAIIKNDLPVLIARLKEILGTT